METGMFIHNMPVFMYFLHLVPSVTPMTICDPLSENRPSGVDLQFSLRV